MLRGNTPCVSKKGSIDGESKPNPPVRYRVGDTQVLLHPPSVRMALPLLCDTPKCCLCWNEKGAGEDFLCIFKIEYDCVFERCRVGLSATDSLYWFEQKINPCLKSKREKTGSSVTLPWGTEDLKPCKNQSLISTGILAGIWSECIPMLEFPVQYFGASFFSSKGFPLPSVYQCN